MAKFYGAVGYGINTEISPGVWQDTIVEKMYYGDVTRNTRRLQEGENLNNDLTVGNSISVISDDYMTENFFAIRYLRWAGILWTVTDVEVRDPRLILRLGGVYNGPTAASPRYS